MPQALRAALVVPCVLLGAAVSVCAVALHGYGWGLLLALVTTAAVMVALPAGWWSRLPFAIGWIAILAAAVPDRPEGDYLIAADVSGYLLLVAGMAVLAVAVATLRPRPRPRPPAD